MPKLKTHRGTAKRFKVTGSGRIKRRRAFRNHILTKKSTKQKRHLRVSRNLVSKADQPGIERLLAGA